MKKNYSFILLFIGIILLIACTNNPIIDDKNEIARENLPSLEVVAENDRLEAAKGTASWTIENGDGTTTAVEMDTADPTELVKDMERLSASPGSRLQLEFSDNPGEIIVNLWEENEQLEQDSTNMEIILPDLESVLVYEVIATWEQGTVHYAFSVEIE